MNAILLEAHAARVRITIYALLCAAVIAGIACAAVEADEQFKRQDLAMQEQVKW